MSDTQPLSADPPTQELEVDPNLAPLRDLATKRARAILSYASGAGSPAQVRLIIALLNLEMYPRRSDSVQNPADPP